VNRVGRLMRDAGLKGIPQRKRWRRKPSDARPATVRDHLKREFKAKGPNTIWVTDITYIHTAEHWLYLCVVIDLYSRQGGRLVDERRAGSATRVADGADGLVAADRSIADHSALGPRHAVYQHRISTFPERS
jgi:transposase InsO family protein